MNKTDRRILVTATLVLLGMLYLLYDDSLLLPSENSKNLVSVGKISQANHDVRRKVSKQFVWRSARNDDVVHVGDSLFTGKNSVAYVQLQDGRTLTIKENSMIVFSTVGDQLSLDLRFGQLAGNLDGCVKVQVKGKEQEVCGKNNEVQIDAADGSIKIDETPKELIVWSQPPPERFYHFKNQSPLKLSWKANGRFGRYRLQFSRYNDFAQVFFEEKTQGLEISTRAYPKSGEVFVRIEADDLKGQKAAYSKTIKMTVAEIQAPLILAPQASQKIILKTSVDGELLESPQVALNWSYALKNATFEYQLSTDPKFQNVLFQSKPLLGLSAKTEKLNPGQYFLRVRDTARLGDLPRPWSETVAFSMELQEPPKLPAPKLLTEKIEHIAPSPEPLTLKWEPVENAQGYVVTVAADPEFQNTKEFSTIKPEITINNLKSGSSYYKVVAKTAKGTTSEASSTGQYQVRLKRPTLNPVEPVVLLGKSPQDPGDPQTLKVSWSDLQVVDSYTVEVSEDKSFKDKVEYQMKSPEGEITLPKPGDYFWRVRGVSEAGKPVTRFSDPGQMNYTLKVPLATPELLEPFDQMTLYFQKSESPFIWFEWKAVRQATKFHLEMATDPEFTNKVFTATSSNRRYLLKDQLPQTLLYWRVQAQGDDDRVSNWSPVRQLSILSGRAPAGRKPSAKGSQR